MAITGWQHPERRGSAAVLTSLSSFFITLFSFTSKGQKNTMWTRRKGHHHQLHFATSNTNQHMREENLRPFPTLHQNSSNKCLPNTRGAKEEKPMQRRTSRSASAPSCSCCPGSATRPPRLPLSTAHENREACRRTQLSWTNRDAVLLRTYHSTTSGRTLAYFGFFKNNILISQVSMEHFLGQLLLSSFSAV